MRQVLLIDDERIPHKIAEDIDLTIARTSEHARELLEGDKVFSELWLDHDLGKPDGVTIDESSKLIEFLCERSHEGRPVAEAIYVHSFNPVGAKDLERSLSKWYPVRRVLPGDLHLIKVEISEALSQLRLAVYKAGLQAKSLEMLATRYVSAATSHAQEDEHSAKRQAIATEAWAMHDKVATISRTIRAAYVDLELHGRLLSGEDDLDADRESLQILSQRLHDDLAALDSDLTDLSTYNIAARQAAERLHDAATNLQNSVDEIARSIEVLDQVEIELGRPAQTLPAQDISTEPELGL